MLFDKGNGKRPMLLTLLSVFYVVATAMAFVVVALRLTGNDVELPFEASTAWLAIEGLIFLFMAYGLFTGWKAAWAVALVMNTAWTVVDTYNWIQGSLELPLPVIIAVASLVILLLGSTRRYTGIVRRR